MVAFVASGARKGRSGGFLITVTVVTSSQQSEREGRGDRALAVGRPARELIPACTLATTFPWWSTGRSMQIESESLERFWNNQGTVGGWSAVISMLGCQDRGHSLLVLARPSRTRLHFIA